MKLLGLAVKLVLSADRSRAELDLHKQTLNVNLNPGEVIDWLYDEYVAKPQQAKSR